MTDTSALSRRMDKNICDDCNVEHLGEDCPKFNPDFDPTNYRTWSSDDIGQLIDLAKETYEGDTAQK